MKRAAMWVLVLGTASCRGEAPADEGATTVESVIEATLPAEALEGLPAGFEAKAAELGWRRTPTGFEGVFPLPEADLVFGDAVVKSDRKGLLAESALPAAPALPRVRTSAGERPLTAVRDPRTKRLTYRLVVPFAAGDCCVAAAGDEPMEGRCLDYNGTYTDGRNYPKSDPRAFRNFIGSDCSIALSRGHCGGDHINGGCFKNHGGKLCSALIGHSSSYHTH